MKPQKALVVVNRGSRSGKLYAKEIPLALAHAGVSVKETMHCTGAELKHALERIRSGDFDSVVACGGDGTVAALAEICIEKKLPLGIIPTGTGNSFARRLGIPLDIPGASRVIAEGILTPAEVGYCNDQIFLDLCSFGLSQTVKDNLNPDMKRIFGRGAYIFAILNSVKNIAPLEIKLTVDGHSFRVSTFFLAVGPGVLHGGFAVLHPEAKPNDGKLHGYYLLGEDKTSILQLPVAIMSGAPGTYPGINALVGKEILIESTIPLTVVLDGESRDESTLRLRELSYALQVYGLPLSPITTA